MADHLALVEYWQLGSLYCQGSFVDGVYSVTTLNFGPTGRHDRSFDTTIFRPYWQIKVGFGVFCISSIGPGPINEASAALLLLVQASAAVIAPAINIINVELSKSVYDPIQPC